MAQLELFAPQGEVMPPVPMVTTSPTASTAQPWPPRHPRANRASRLGDLLVAYEFRRSRRRTLGLTVGPLGLSVRAPQWAPLAEVERFLHSKADWVAAKLRQLQERQAMAGNGSEHPEG